MKIVPLTFSKKAGHTTYSLPAAHIDIDFDTGQMKSCLMAPSGA